MEKQKDGWPEQFVLFPALERVKQVVHFIFDQVHWLPPEEPEARGAEAMLSTMLDEAN